jgi:Ca-activated chloride channel family protein
MMKISLSDSRLTSFVLGELTETERKEIQTAINADPQLKTEIETIQQTIKEIENAMQNESLPEKNDNKITTTPKTKKRFVRIAVTVAMTAVLLITGIAVFAPSVLREATGVLKNNAHIHRSCDFAYDKAGVFKMCEENVLERGESVSAIGQARYSVAKVLEEELAVSAPPQDPNSPNNETYKNVVENEFKPVKVGEFSTFSIDVDTASYTTMRRYLSEMDKRPPADSVRLEEYINYFKYDYALPTDGKPFVTHVDVFNCPWEPKHLLARIGIKGKEYRVDERPALNLVFLIDVSGSMSASNRLPLVKCGLAELVEMLQPRDRVAIVTYAGESRVALPSVSGQEKRAILDSINSLGAGGSTAGAAGIKTAYEVAKKYYNKEAQNRVVLCTDGDFNVGETNNKTLETMIGDEAKSGVFLTILGFGMGNYKDERLKTLSMRGNGNYGYIDSLDEARRLLVEGLTGTLFAIAKDVKIQVDFNPAKVAGYRLIGYENRKLRDEDFHNDKIDAGEIGAGHTVTALYEIVPAEIDVPATIDKSRYAEDVPLANDTNKNSATKNNTENDNSTKSNSMDSPMPIKSEELMFVKLRYKLPDADKSLLLEYPVSAVTNEMSSDSQFIAAVALFGMLLRDSKFSGSGNFDTVLELATPNTKNNQYRNEFLKLVKKAKELQQ